MNSLGLELTAFLPAFLRAAAFLTAAPLTGDRQLPPRARIALAALLAMVIAHTRPRLGWGELPLVLPGELLLGLAMGFSARLVLAGAEAGGHLIALQLGLGFAGSFDAGAGEESLTPRRIVAALAGLAFLATGGLETAVRGLAVPMPSALAPGAAVLGVMQRGGEVMVIAVRLAAPAIIAALVGNIAMAMLSRAAPALNAFSAMLAVALVIGAITLLATAPVLARQLLAIGRRAGDAMTAVVAP